MDLNTEILKEIRDALRGTNQRLDQTNERLDQTNQRVDQLAQHQIRMSTQLAELTGVARESLQLTGMLVKEVNRLSDRVDHVLVGPLGSTVRDHEERIRRLEEKLRD
ncbi:MAG: hypothetical protein AB2A00_06775 [Myxococcota bacterium]